MADSAVRDTVGATITEDVDTRQWWVSRVGIALVGSVAALLATASRAEANHCGSWYHYGCCCLSMAPGTCPGGNSASHTCRTGYTKRQWTCCDYSGSLLRRCSECTKGVDCWHGPWDCSASWTATPPCYG